MALPSIKKKSGSASKISAVSCPKGMSLRQWQITLRRQAAQNQIMGVKTPQTQGDPFIVTSAKSGRSYRVDYYGSGSPLNRCECMDYKTSTLGTCKHIEAISLADQGRYAHKLYPAPKHSFVFVDYPAGRKIRIHFGTSASQEFRNLAAGMFDSDGIILDMTCDPSDFIRQATRLDPGFVWEADAMDLLIDTRDRKRRTQIIADRYAHSYFDGLIKTTLHPYQADGVRFAFTGGRTINADEMGLGKTVQAIATAELLRRECNIESVIVICPTSLKYQWLSEIRRFTDSTVIVIEGDILKRREQLTNPSYFYKICSFHALSNSIKAGFIPSTDMVIYDELQRLKNRETKMGQQLRKLRSQYVLALSGTPLENKLDELYSVTQLVDQYVLGPYYKFTAESTLTDDSGKIIGYHNLHAVAKKLRDTLIRRRKADVKLQMPGRTDTNLFVPMTKEQRAIHDEYKFQVSIIIQKWKRFKFLSEADRKRLLLFLSMMRMVCDSTFILDQKSRYDTKIDEIRAIISNLLDEQDGKVVIFSQWERMLRILSHELEQEDIEFCFLHGGVPSPKRKKLIDDFHDNPECRIFLSTDAGATGLNLQAASLLINVDLPWNPAVLEQRIARIYRLGQENPVQIINMIARDTIEERMLSTLRFKSNLASGILDGGDDAVFIENSKFEKVIEIVDDVVSISDNPTDNEQTNPKEEASSDASDVESTEPTAVSTAAQEVSEKATPETEDAAPSSHNSTDKIDRTPPAATTSDEKSADNRPTQASRQTSSDEMRKIVSNGFSALSRIADVLREPEGIKTLTDALVKEDPATGETSINIPVADRTVVSNLLTAFSALLNRK